MLSAGAIHSGRLVLKAKPVVLREIVRDAIEAVESEIASRRQRVDCELPRETLRVPADRRHARIALTNLLSNASKYGPEGEAIGVRVEKLDGYALFVVEDRGPGVSAEEQSRLFERFCRADSWSDKPGVGLGLAIAKSIVEAHGGEIAIDGTTASGARIWFTLPLAKEVGDANSAGG